MGGFSKKDKRKKPGGTRFDKIDKNKSKRDEKRSHNLERNRRIRGTTSQQSSDKESNSDNSQSLSSVNSLPPSTIDNINNSQKYSDQESNSDNSQSLCSATSLPPSTIDNINNSQKYFDQESISTNSQSSKFKGSGFNSNAEIAEQASCSNLTSQSLNTQIHNISKSVKRCIPQASLISLPPSKRIQYASSDDVAEADHLDLESQTQIFTNNQNNLSFVPKMNYVSDDDSDSDDSFQNAKILFNETPIASPNNSQVSSTTSVNNDFSDDDINQVEVFPNAQMQASSFFDETTQDTLELPRFANINNNKSYDIRCDDDENSYIRIFESMPEENNYFNNFNMDQDFSRSEDLEHTVEANFDMENTLPDIENTHQYYNSLVNSTLPTEAPIPNSNLPTNVSTIQNISSPQDSETTLISINNQVENEELENNNENNESETNSNNGDNIENNQTTNNPDERSTDSSDEQINFPSEIDLTSDNHINPIPVNTDNSSNDQRAIDPEPYNDMNINNVFDFIDRDDFYNNDQEPQLPDDPDSDDELNLSQNQDASAEINLNLDNSTTTDDYPSIENPRDRTRAAEFSFRHTSMLPIRERRNRTEPIFNMFRKSILEDFDEEECFFKDEDGNPTYKLCLGKQICCPHCGARIFQYEIETNYKCCHNGRLKDLSLMEDMSQFPEFQRLFDHHEIIDERLHPEEKLRLRNLNKYRKLFKTNIRRINASLAFGSFNHKDPERQRRVNAQINNGHRRPVFISGANFRLTGGLDPTDLNNPCNRRYLGLYMFEGQRADNLRNINMNINPSENDTVGQAEDKRLLRNMIRNLANEIRASNPIAQYTRMVAEEYEPGVNDIFAIRLIDKEANNCPALPTHHQFRPPTRDQIGLLRPISLDPENPTPQFEICINLRDHTLNYISPWHSLSDPFVYPTLWPNGRPGYSTRMRYIETKPDGTEVSKKLYFKDFINFHLFKRENEYNLLLRGGPLLQQYLCEVMFKMEYAILNYQNYNQTLLRSCGFNAILNCLENPNLDILREGTKYLPPSFNMGPRYLKGNKQQCLTACDQITLPDFFLTLTGNLTWPEICDNLEEGEEPMDRPELVTRVFVGKLRATEDLLLNDACGRVVTYARCIEVQESGNPHAHIVFGLKDCSKPHTPHAIDTMVCAEIPDPEQHPKLYEQVKKTQIHTCIPELCRKGRRHDQPCKKGFPKEFQSHTVINDNNKVKYRRRSPQDGGHSVIIRGRDGHDVVKDNRWVVPYNKKILMFWCGHCNMERSSGPGCIGYIFKYIFKALTHQHARIERQGPNQQQRPGAVEGDNGEIRQMEEIHDQNGRPVRDEIEHYLICALYSPCLAVLRISGTALYRIYPAVTNLGVYLPGEQQIIYDQNTNVEDLNRIQREGKNCHLEAFFAQVNVELRQPLTEIKLKRNKDENNELYPPITDLIYKEVPKYYRFYKAPREQQYRWHRKVTYNHRFKTLGQTWEVSPSKSELFSLKLLLDYVVAPTSYEDLRTFEGTVYETFKEAAEARGLIRSSQVYNSVMRSGAVFRNPNALRWLFVSLITNCQVPRPRLLFESNERELAMDFYNTRLRENRDHVFGDRERNLALFDIEDKLQKQNNTFTLAQFGLEFDWINLEHREERLERPLIFREAEYDREQQARICVLKSEQATDEQRMIFDTVVRTSELPIDHPDRPPFIFIEAPGGCGKTFIAEWFLAYNRKDGKIALAAATSGTAATLLPGGKTCHNAFKLPLDMLENRRAKSSITPISPQGQLIQQTAFVLIDEICMQTFRLLQVLNYLFKDCKISAAEKRAWFGGTTLVVMGDFGQCLPIVNGADDTVQILTTIKRLSCWPQVMKLHLTTNMRVFLRRNDEDQEQVARLENFVELLGKVRTGNHERGNGPSIHHMALEEEMVFDSPELNDFIDSIYNKHNTSLENLNVDLSEANYTENVQRLMEAYDGRAILSPKNVYTTELNDMCLNKLPGEVTSYDSNTRFFLQTNHHLHTATERQAEDALKKRFISSMPPHRLRIKVGSVVMCLRNKMLPLGVANGTRLLVLVCRPNLLQCMILSKGPNQGNTVYIHKMDIEGDDFHNRKIVRYQFPVRLCFAMTINKAQGQTLERYGVYLPETVFSHGQLYVALSRAGTPDSVTLFISHDERHFGQDGKTYTKNIVRREVLTDLLNEMGNLTDL